MTGFVEEHELIGQELLLWRAAGLKARLWLRDDDAGEVVPRLTRLLDLSERHQVPLLLAAIPVTSGPALATAVKATACTTVSVHGFAHKNHAPDGEKSQELGLHRPTDVVFDELADGRQRLGALMGERLTDILVPPWNRIAPAVVAKLPQLGFSALSTFGKADEAAVSDGLIQLNTHLDIIDWKGTRGGRDPAWLARELVRLLKVSREEAAGRDPIGVLTHHKVHDGVAWDFLDMLLDVTVGHPAVDWCDAGALVRPGTA